MSDETDWEDVRRDYEGRTLRTIEILAKHNITITELNKRIKAEGWIKRLSAVAASKAAKAAAAETLVSESATPADSVPVAIVATAIAKPPTTIAQRRKILERLHNTIAKKLALIEERVEKQGADGTSISAADFERDTRSVAQLIKSLEQATGFHHDQRGKRISGAAAKSASIAATALADEADRLRRELAERLQRLVDPAGE